MSDDTILPFGFPAVDRKTLVAAFDGGRITADGGVLLLGMVERQLGIAAKLARLIADPRNPALVTHSVDDILRARILAIACGYEACCLGGHILLRCPHGIIWALLWL